MRRRSAAAVVLVALATLLAPWQRATVRAAVSDVETGEHLFEENCASCHGEEGEGSSTAPSLGDSGAAAADFQLRTGRMPLANPSAQAVRKPPAFDDEQIRALVAYIASLGDGPPIPSVSGYPNADLTRGQELFNGNCAPCHGATANGGAVGGDAFAPSLYRAEPEIVAEATVIGPGQMPRFAFSPQDRDAIVRYVHYLQTSSAPGGLDIGGVGPVPEGFVAWMIGMVALVVISVLVGHHWGQQR